MSHLRNHLFLPPEPGLETRLVLDAGGESTLTSSSFSDSEVTTLQASSFLETSNPFAFDSSSLLEVDERTSFPTATAVEISPPGRRLALLRSRFRRSPPPGEKIVPRVASLSTTPEVVVPIIPLVQVPAENEQQGNERDSRPEQDSSDSSATSNPQTEQASSFESLPIVPPSLQLPSLYQHSETPSTSVTSTGIDQRIITDRSIATQTSSEEATDYLALLPVTFVPYFTFPAEQTPLTVSASPQSSTANIASPYHTSVASPALTSALASTGIPVPTPEAPTDGQPEITEAQPRKTTPQLLAQWKRFQRPLVSTPEVPAVHPPALHQQEEHGHALLVKALNSLTLGMAGLVTIQHTRASAPRSRQQHRGMSGSPDDPSCR